MVCPRCGAEYVAGFTRCSDCLVDLVEAGDEGKAPAESAPAEPADQAGPAAPAGPARLTDPVCAYRATQRGRLPIAVSMLQSAGIPFVVAGEHMQQLTGLDVFGPAEVYVSKVDSDDAREVLAGLDQVD